MKRIAGLQIFYLPWLGVFHQIANVDLFFFADDSQYTRGWINRNRIINPTGGFTWLTVPIHRAGVETAIRDVRIANSIQWRKKHLRAIDFAYRKAPFFAELQPRLERSIGGGHEWLVDLNLELLHELIGLLRLDTEIRLKSEFQLSEDRNQALVDACKQNEADLYFSGPSARDYLDHGLFERHGIQIEFQEFEHPEYEQLGRGEFISHLSAIDALFMLGPDEVRRIILPAGDA